jgi:uncharacterized membrane protein
MRAVFTKNRLEAFSDGVLAIVITIMVLELKVPHHAAGADGAHGEGHGGVGLGDLRPLVPVFLSYVLSFVYLGIYWNNHHHLLHATPRVNGGILWANLHLLFWLSLVPFATGWMGENEFAAAPTALYGVVLLLSALAYMVLQTCILKVNGRGSAFAAALGRDIKGKVSLLAYAAGIGLSFVNPLIAGGLYALVAVMWLIPDRRIERAIGEAGGVAHG